MKQRYRYKAFSDSEEIDPMGSLVNLFDVAMVFAVALMASDEIDEVLKLPLEKMNNYLLKSILDHNLKINV